MVNSSCQGGGIARWNSHGILAGRKELTRSAGSRGDNGLATGHRLHDRAPERLRARAGMDDNIQSAIHRGRVALKIDEPDFRFDAEIPGLRLQQSARNLRAPRAING